MSTNKTPNYQLHSWLPSDEFHVSEINENFAALDGALKAEADSLTTAVAQAMARPVVGQYTTLRDAPVNIALGFRPRMVVLDSSSSNYVIGAVSTDLTAIYFSVDRSRRLIDAGVMEIPLTAGGFTIPANAPLFNSNADLTVKYQAFR